MMQNRIANEYALYNIAPSKIPTKIIPVSVRLMKLFKMFSFLMIDVQR